MTDQTHPTLSTGLAYRDPIAALKWLEAAFGFETTMVVTAEDGTLAHSEMRVGEDGLIMVGREWDAHHRSPASLEGINTQSVHVQIDGDVDAHCARARAAGAVISREPADQFYGDRLYAAVDPEGHVWTFARTFRTLSHEEMSKAGGLNVATHL